jgi:hypothetical protein
MCVFEVRKVFHEKKEKYFEHKFELFKVNIF